MGELEKAMFYDAVEKKPVYVQFNPNSLEYSYAGGTQQSGGQGTGRDGGAAPGAGMQNGWPFGYFRQQSPLDTRTGARLSMRLFFSTYTDETAYTDVREKLKPLRAFLCKTGDSRIVGKKVIFAWGSLGFKGYLDSFSVTYQMFASDGTPVQAEASVSMEGDDADISDEDRKTMKKTVDTGGDGSLKKSFAWLFG